MTGITWTGEVLFTDSSDVGTTGVATLTLTPSVGVSNLPALAAGTPGLPPVFDSVTATSLTPGSTPTVALTQTATGGAGTASHYTMTFGIPAGATGSPGPSTAILTAPDVEGTATDKYTLAYSSSTSKMEFTPQKVPLLYQPTTYSAYSGNAATSTALASVTINNTSGYNVRPLVWGFIQPTGTTNCRISVRAVLGSNADSSDLLAYGAPMTPATSGSVPPVTVDVRPAFGNAIGSGSSYGLITAGATGVVNMYAKQTAAVNDSWGVASTAISMFVMAVPVL